MYIACTANSSVICKKHTSYTLQVEAIPSYVNSWPLSPSWYAWRLSRNYTWKLTSMAIVFVWERLDPSKKSRIFLNNWKLGTSFLTYHIHHPQNCSGTKSPHPQPYPKKHSIWAPRPGGHSPLPGLEWEDYPPVFDKKCTWPINGSSSLKVIEFLPVNHGNTRTQVIWSEYCSKCDLTNYKLPSFLLQQAMRLVVEGLNSTWNIR